MCGAIEGIRTDARAEGKSEQLLGSVRNLMAATGWAATDALDKLGVPKGDWPRYLALLAEPLVN